MVSAPHMRSEMHGALTHRMIARRGGRARLARRAASVRLGSATTLIRSRLCWSLLWLRHGWRLLLLRVCLRLRRRWQWCSSAGEVAPLQLHGLLVDGRGRRWRATGWARCRGTVRRN